MSGMSESFLDNYQEVEAFEESNEEEYEEETFYVNLDLGPLDPKLVANATNYRLVGLETAKPFLQMGTSIFRGEHETLLGTEIVMQEPSNNGSGSRHFTPLAITDKRIRFREVRLTLKQPPMDWEADDDEADDDIQGTAQPNRTLGGVSRDAQTEFFPSSKKGKNPVHKAKRRWRKRPEGYHTGDEDEAGETNVVEENREEGEVSNDHEKEVVEDDGVVNQESGDGEQS